MAGVMTARSTTRTRLPNGLLRSSCSECPDTASQHDQGLGRATLAAWESRHGANCTKTHEHEFSYDDLGRMRCACGTYLFEHAPGHPYGSQPGPGGMYARWCLRDDCDWRSSGTTRPTAPCSCGKPFPEDGGAEGLCECCSGCGVAS